MSKKVVKCNVEIFWCNHQRPAELSNKYEVTLGNLSDDAVSALKELGLGDSLKSRPDKPEMGTYVLVKSNLPLPIEDQNGSAIEARIANHSKGVAVVGFYEWEFRAKKGVSPSLDSLVMTDLRLYENTADIARDSSVPTL